MNKLLLGAAALFAAVMLFAGQHGATPDEVRPSVSEQNAGKSTVGSGVLSKNESSRQVSGHGVVTRLLADDTKGSRHQKFILTLSSGETILVAHNIDLAPRISDLKEGDAVQFYGEYEWNEKGGVLHWTHRDPKGAHAAGWLQHKGRKYQ